MTPFARACTAAVLALAAGPVVAAPEKDIDAAVQKGAEYLKGRFKGGPAEVGNQNYGIGPTALAGLALLEAKVPADDAAVRAVAAAVRNAGYKECKTYQLALCLLFLDKLEDPADVPLIQMLAVRLLAGQNTRGGWAYECLDGVPENDERLLRAGLKTAQLDTGGGKDAPKDAGGKPVGRLHSVVRDYSASLWSRRNPNRADDNSNTQFAVLAVWAARKHGVPVEPALDLIDRRFVSSQNPQSGGWGYKVDDRTSTPAMTCAGLIGLSIGVGRRSELRATAEIAAKEKKAAGPKSADPFFNPPPRADDKKKDERRPADPRDTPARIGLHGLGVMVVEQTRTPDGFALTKEHTYYALWSMERVGVIYGVDRIGGIDWYAAGSDVLVRGQGPGGDWAGGSYGPEVNTALAVLFLTKSNLARDLSSRVRNPANTELRAGSPAVPAPSPKLPDPGAASTPRPNPLPSPVADEAAARAAELARAADADWAKALDRVRDAKGAEHTRVLALAIGRVDGPRKKQAREALAERLTRMTAETLRGLTRAADPEVRRGAVLACAMKDDPAHVPDLIDRLADEEELVARAAHAGLKSLTGQDHGPRPGATAADRTAAAAAWRAWWAKRK